MRNRLKSTDNFTSRSTKHDISKFTGKVMLSVMCICQHGSSLYDHHLDKLVHLGTPPQPGPGPHHPGTCSALAPALRHVSTCSLGPHHAGIPLTLSDLAGKWAVGLRLNRILVLKLFLHSCICTTSRINNLCIPAINPPKTRYLA